MCLFGDVKGMMPVLADRLLLLCIPAFYGMQMRAYDVRGCKKRILAAAYRLQWQKLGFSML
jgi:hypothetical protein